MPSNLSNKDRDMLIAAKLIKKGVEPVKVKAVLSQSPVIQDGDRNQEGFREKALEYIRQIFASGQRIVNLKEGELVQ